MYNLKLKVQLLNKTNLLKSKKLSNLAFSLTNYNIYIDDFEEINKNNKNNNYCIINEERLKSYSGCMCNECKGIGWVAKKNIRLSCNIEFIICNNCNGNGYIN
tara:strand:- start:4600 stop:4908 length:309 start_codon:yes stop_codon:yes gene_type:complete